MDSSYCFPELGLTGSCERLAIGVGNNNRTGWYLRWWESESGEAHSGDGSSTGPFSGQSSNSEWTYGDGDCVGCCIDSVLGKAYFTRNGAAIGKLNTFLASILVLKGLLGAGTCLTNLVGRLFPVVVARPETAIVANFGRDLAAKPFKYPDGLTRRYEAEERTDSAGADEMPNSVLRKLTKDWLTESQC